MDNMSFFLGAIVVALVLIYAIREIRYGLSKIAEDIRDVKAAVQQASGKAQDS